MRRGWREEEEDRARRKRKGRREEEEDPKVLVRRKREREQDLRRQQRAAKANSNQALANCQKAGALLVEASSLFASQESEARRVRSSLRVATLRDIGSTLLQVKTPQYRVSDPDVGVRTASDVESKFASCVDDLARHLAEMQLRISRQSDLDSQTREQLMVALRDLNQAMESVSRISLDSLYDSVVDVRSVVLKAADLIGDTLGILGSRDSSMISFRGAKRAVDRALDLVRQATRR